jgi:hypothetical protein
MDGNSNSTEARLAALEQAVRALEARFGAGGDGADLDSPASGIVATAAAPRAFDPVALLTLVGRTLVLLGGAYLLRAITESGMLPVAIGVALGLAYAALWLIAADRAAAIGAFWSAVTYGATATIIALPLLFEAMVRFGIVHGVAGAVLLTAVAVTVLAVAVRTQLQPLAWVAVCGAVAASVSLTAATGFVLPFAIADIAIGVVTLWIGYTSDWVWLRWVPAAIANFAVQALASGIANHSTTSPPWAVVATQLLLFAGYFASIAVRTLVRKREVNLFETVQGTAALAVGFGGAVYVTQATGSGAGLLVAIGLVCAAAAYAVAFAFVARRQGLHRNYYFYTSMAIVLVLASTAALPAVSVLAWASLAIVASWAAARSDHWLLSVHGAVYLIAAAAGSGLLEACGEALVGAPATVSPSPLLVGAFAAGCACWAAPPAAYPSPPLVRVPRVVVAFLVMCAAAAAVVATAASAWSDPGTIATLRTAVIAVAALTAAALGRGSRFEEAGFLVYPLLIAGGVKLVMEDLPRSRPATLFVALGVYGVALIAAPRVARHTTDTRHANASTDEPITAPADVG